MAEILRSNAPEQKENQPGNLKTPQERLDLAHKSATELTEAQKEKLEKIIDKNEFAAKLKEVAEKWQKLDTKNQNEVLKFRQRVLELDFMVNYVKENENIAEEIGENLAIAENLLTEIQPTLLDQSKNIENLEKTRDEISPREFKKLSINQKLQLVSNIDTWDELKNGTLVVFNFGKNRKLEYQVGLGDLMPTNIRTIAVNGKQYERKGSQGFYDRGKYLPIFNGSKVSIVETDNNYDPAKEYKEVFGENYGKNQEGKDELDTKLENLDITRKEILEIAKEFSIDAYFLEAVVAIMKEERAHQIKDPVEFAHIAARYIQNAENKYLNTDQEPPIKNGHYTAEFIYYALDHFNLFNSFSPYNPYREQCFNYYNDSANLGLTYIEEKDVQETANNTIETIKELGFANIENLTNQQLIDYFENMSVEQLLNLRDKVGASKLKDTFEETGLKKYSQKETLVREIEQQVNALREDNVLVRTFGNKENLIKRVSQVAAQESGFKAYNWSSTDCMGFFQFTRKNTEHYKINPLNPISAVAGLLLLWHDHAKHGLDERGLIIAHNRGPKNIDAEGQTYYEKVLKIDLDKFTEDKNTLALNTKINLKDYVSAAFERSETGTTLCSRTAAKNLRMLGVANPKEGNANDVKAEYLNSNYKKISGSKHNIVNALNELPHNERIAAIDLLVKGSDTPDGQRYGHRAAAYRSFNGKWMVLDPYLNGTRKGIELENYNGQIEFVVPLTAEGTSV